MATTKKKTVTVTVRNHKITVDANIMDSAEFVMLMALDPEEAATQDEVVSLIRMARKVVGAENLRKIIADVQKETGHAPASLPVEVLMETLSAAATHIAALKN